MDNRKILERSSNLELLRIISMLMIIAYHILLEGYHFGESVINGTKILELMLGSWGLLGANCFFLISFWNLQNEENGFKFEKIIKILLKTVIYGVGISVVCVFCFQYEATGRQMIQSVMAPFSGIYWFVTAYIIIYCLHPFLNKFINALSTASLVKLWIMLTLLFPLYHTICATSPFDDVTLVVYLYLLVAVMRRKPDNLLKKKCNVIFGILILCTVFIELLNDVWLLNERLWTILWGRYSVIQMALAVALFYIFSDIRISSKIINRISRRTLGVYLIHTHFIGFSILMAKMLPWIEKNEQQLRVIPFVMIVLLVFVVACCVDAVVEWVIEKPLIGFIKKYMDKPINKINQWMRELV